MRVELKILDSDLYKSHDLPTYQTPGSAAMDLVSAEDVVLIPGECKLIKTGVAIWVGSSLGSRPVLQTDYDSVWDYLSLAAQILPRSGRGHKEGLILGNSIGLIDEDYQGELMVSAWNRNSSRVTEGPFLFGGDELVETCEVENNAIVIKRGERFAQIMFIPVIKAQWDVVEEFSNVTTRNNNSFGSSGV